MSSQLYYYKIINISNTDRHKYSDLYGTKIMLKPPPPPPPTPTPEKILTRMIRHLKRVEKYVFVSA